ncbi:MAG TPA: molecular chaperone DnaK, partial [Candidatus Altiarchaeales archaeon]|nr:molecular chaperone DnaK [Candidatus Altiarchaeales archaeon]
IPTRKSKIFTTAEDFQTAVTIHVVQGERPLAKDNTSLGMFNLVGIPPAPRGVPQIEVTFDIDANGILHVSAKDLGTGKEQKITITASTKLSKEEIERMMKEAEKFAEEDKRRKEEIETRNEADSMIYTAEKVLNEFKDKISRDVEQRVRDKIKELKDALAGKDVNLIKNKISELKKVLQEVGMSVYQAAYTQPSAESKTDKTQEGASSDSSEKEGIKKEKVVDAEYEVVDDDKKE